MTEEQLPGASGSASAWRPWWWVWIGGGVVVVVLVAAVAGGVGWYLGNSQAEGVASVEPVEAESSGAQRTRTDPLFVEPVDLGGLIAETKQHTVTVLCGEASGTGWIVDTNAEPVVRPKMREAYGSKYSSTVVTAEHVITECRREGLDVGVQVGQTLVSAVLMNWDKEADVATIGIAREAQGARPFTFAPDGTWAMTVGATIPELLVPVIGEVVHNDGFLLYTHFTVQAGNSGGPVVNSRGEVIATIGGSIVDEETGDTTGWGYATPVAVLCERLFECSSMGIDAS